MLLGINEFLITSFRGGLSRAFFLSFENSSEKIELYSDLFYTSQCTIRKI